MARSQPSSNDGLETAEPGHRSERKHSSRRPCPAAYALEERRSRHSSSPVVQWIAPPLPLKRKRRRNRRAPSASAGGKAGCDEHSRSELTGFLPAVGDRQIAGCSAVNPRYRLSVSVGCSLRYLRDLRDLRANCDGGRPSCLCVFVFAMPSVFLSVPLWFNRWAATKKGVMPVLRELLRGACRTSVPTRSGLAPPASGRSRSGVRSR